MNGWSVAVMVVLAAGGAVLYLIISLRGALHDLAVLERTLMQEAARASMWQQQCEVADEEVVRLEAKFAATATAFTAEDMAFLFREASRLTGNQGKQDRYGVD